MAHLNKLLFRKGYAKFVFCTDSDSHTDTEVLWSLSFLHNRK